MRHIAPLAGRPAARGRYAMQAVREAFAELQGRFARAAKNVVRPAPVPGAFYEAAAGAYRGDTLEIVNQWSGDSETLEFDAASDHDAPQPS